jgi:hypothetical protein
MVIVGKLTDKKQPSCKMQSLPAKRFGRPASPAVAPQVGSSLYLVSETVDSIDSAPAHRIWTPAAARDAAATG